MNIVAPANDTLKFEKINVKFENTTLRDKNCRLNLYNSTTL